jgi:apolipoprotein D and lipocalin family protein
MRLLLCFFSLALATSGIAYAAQPAVQTVPHVDHQRYLGKWYEIASYPAFFQRNCDSNSAALYSTRPDGAVNVLNTCRTKSGGIDSANGRATVVEGSNNAKLDVSFFRTFSGDYWIIGLDRDYRWAVVGSPNRKYLWILSRTPQLQANDLDQAKAAAQAQGFDLTKLRETKQSVN